MGKKRVVKKDGTSVDKNKASRSLARSTKKRLDHGTLYIISTYNNTSVNLTDEKGNSVMWSSSGSLGFKGAKKGTPFAAGKVAELLAEKAIGSGIKDIDVVLSGVGAGREAAVRAFISKGISLSSVRDITPVPFNGPRPRKPRRV
ncbi:MAG TPA: 30S ribosomal protein S11 [Candidatus Paceibacterota bacterium]